MKLKKLFKSPYFIILIIIFLLGTALRFVNFTDSVYFGYDEARDAFVSQQIYTRGEYKLIGPQASIYPGIHHGPIYYYLLGPLFLISKGDPYFVSIFFRVINALGIVGVFIIGYLLFEPLVGLISAFIFALSYEQFIYAIFTGNPSISNLSWIITGLGIGLIYKYKDKKLLGLVLVLLGPAIATQFDLLTGFGFIFAIFGLHIFRKKLKNISWKNWLIVLVIGLAPLMTYVVAEIKFNFLASKTIWEIINSTASINTTGQDNYFLVFTNLLNLIRDNVTGNPSQLLSLSLLTLFTVFLLFQARKQNKYYLLIIWPFSILVFLLTRGFMPFYSYAGAGIGIIIGFSVVLAYVFRKNRILAVVILLAIACANVSRISDQSKKSLIVDIKAQPGMKLNDEINVVNQTYQEAGGNNFTIRVTSMPYKIQTTWAYLYNQYGLKQYGYLPLNENGNVEGFPGELPVTKQGTTCLRFLIREPVRGIPQDLINKDEHEENLFSTIIKNKQIGEFILETRLAKSLDCYR